MSVIAQAELLGQVLDILASRSAERFAQLADQLGIELELGTFYPYVAQHAGARLADACGGGGLKLIYQALTTEHGFAMDVIYGQTTLAARAGDRLVYAMQRGSATRPFSSSGWAMGKWFKNPLKNRPAIDAWLADPARATDALTIPIERSITSVPDDRGTALLAAVCADPEDLVARMVYGDWLVDRGDMRGELIRVQCELLARPSEALAAREKELSRAYGAAMLAPLERFVDDARVRRGLVEYVRVFSDRWIEHAEAIVAAHPITELVLLAMTAEELVECAALPVNIPRIKIEGRERRKVANSGTRLNPSAIATSALCANVRRLAFERVEDKSPEWVKFFKAIEAPRLESLEVERLDDKSAMALARSKGMPVLRELRLWDATERTPNFSGAMRVLAQGELSTVEIGGWKDFNVIADCIEELLASPKLTKLTLRFTNATASTLDLIARRGKHLRELAISRCEFLDAVSIARLLEGKGIAKLRRLDLEDVPGDDGSRELLTYALCEAPKSLAEISWRPGFRHDRIGPSKEQLARIAETREVI